jgi:hypothetical protein
MNITELQSLVDKIELLKRNPQMSYSNVYLLCKLLSTQFLAPRIKQLFSNFCTGADVFIYSFQEDPNICQLTLHKPWDRLVFAWIRPDATYLFRIPKQLLPELGLLINHADSTMQQHNVLFKQSIRLTFADAQQLSQFLIEIIPGGLVCE